MSPLPPPMTIEQAYRHYVSLKRGYIIAILLIVMTTVLPIPFPKDTESETGEDPQIEREVLGTLAILKEGNIVGRGGWEAHPIASIAIYLVLHDNVVSLAIAWMLFGALREPTRNRVTAAFWSGLAAGALLWTLCWGYSRYWGYILVFIANTLLMNAVFRNSKTGQIILKATGGRSE